MIKMEFPAWPGGDRYQKISGEINYRISGAFCPAFSFDKFWHEFCCHLLLKFFYLLFLSFIFYDPIGSLLRPWSLLSVPDPDPAVPHELFTCFQRSVLFFHTKASGRIYGRAGHGCFQRKLHLFNNCTHTIHQICGRSCDRTVRYQRGKSSHNLNIQSAQCIPGRPAYR